MWDFLKKKKKKKETIEFDEKGIVINTSAKIISSTDVKEEPQEEENKENPITEDQIEDILYLPIEEIHKKYSDEEIENILKEYCKDYQNFYTDKTEKVKIRDQELYLFSEFIGSDRYGIPLKEHDLNLKIVAPVMSLGVGDLASYRKSNEERKGYILCKNRESSEAVLYIFD